MKVRSYTTATKRVGKGKKTGRLPDIDYWKYNTLPHDMKFWQYACLCCGVSIQCLLLVLVFCMASSGLIYMIDYLLVKFFDLSIIGV